MDSDDNRPEDQLVSIEDQRNLPQNIPNISKDIVNIDNDTNKLSVISRSNDSAEVEDVRQTGQIKSDLNIDLNNIKFKPSRPRTINQKLNFNQKLETDDHREKDKIYSQRPLSPKDKTPIKVHGQIIDRESVPSLTNFHKIPPQLEVRTVHSINGSPRNRTMGSVDVRNMGSKVQNNDQLVHSAPLLNQNNVKSGSINETHSEVRQDIKSPKMFNLAEVDTKISQQAGQRGSAGMSVVNNYPELINPSLNHNHIESIDVYNSITSPRKSHTLGHSSLIDNSGRYNSDRYNSDRYKDNLSGGVTMAHSNEPGERVKMPNKRNPIQVPSPSNRVEPTSVNELSRNDNLTRSSIRVGSHNQPIWSPGLTNRSLISSLQSPRNIVSPINTIRPETTTGYTVSTTPINRFENQNMNRQNQPNNQSSNNQSSNNQSSNNQSSNKPVLVPPTYILPSNQAINSPSIAPGHNIRVSTPIQGSSFFGPANSIIRSPIKPEYFPHHPISSLPPDETNKVSHNDTTWVYNQNNRDKSNQYHTSGPSNLYNQAQPLYDYNQVNNQYNPMNVSNLHQDYYGQNTIPHMPEQMYYGQSEVNYQPITNNLNQTSNHSLSQPIFIPLSALVPINHSNLEQNSFYDNNSFISPSSQPIFVPNDFIPNNQLPYNNGDYNGEINDGSNFKRIEIERIPSSSKTKDKKRKEKVNYSRKKRGKLVQVVDTSENENDEDNNKSDVDDKRGKSDKNEFKEKNKKNRKVKIKTNDEELKDGQGGKDKNNTNTPKPVETPGLDRGYAARRADTSRSVREPTFDDGYEIDITPPTHSRRPDYNNMSLADQASYRAQFQVKIGHLKERYPHYHLRDFDETVPLDIIHGYYEAYYFHFTIRNIVNKWKLGLMAVWFGIELLLTKGMHLNFGGYAFNQINMLSVYEQWIYEFVERGKGNIGAGLAPEIKILLLTGVSAVIFLLVKYIAVWFGPQAATTIQNLINSFITGGPNQVDMRHINDSINRSMPQSNVRVEASDVPPPPQSQPHVPDVPNFMGGLNVANLIQTFGQMFGGNQNSNTSNDSTGSTTGRRRRPVFQPRHSN